MKMQSGAQYNTVTLSDIHSHTAHTHCEFLSLSRSPFLALRFIALSRFQIEIHSLPARSFIHFAHLLAAVCILLFFNPIPRKLRGGIKRLITHVSYGLKLVA